ncbi:MAG: DUF2961 domain-containing protein [Phycisphaerae bacterium]|nr:DUF2961 domain-containing protein [Phycisphaerae bacterium]
MILSTLCGPLIGLTLIAGTGTMSTAGESSVPPGRVASPADALLDRLTQVPTPCQVLQTSSHNKLGRNGDANSPLYTDVHGDGVILDAAGPGCVRSIWGTAFPKEALLKFYFDGEKEPRYKVNQIEFFSGKHPDFPPPLASYDVRGQYEGPQYGGNCFVPIPFEKSLKITIAGGVSFFHVLYDQYPHGTPVQSFTGKEDRAAILDGFTRVGGTPASQPAFEATAAGSGQEAPGKEIVLFDRKQASGIIREIVLDADASDPFFQNTELVMRFDGHERDDVRAPTGMFFGCANHVADVGSLPVTVRRTAEKRAEMHCYFPIPFWHEARIVWRNLSDKPLGPLNAKVIVDRNSIPENRGTYFTTLYRKGETTYRRDWPLFDSPGTGWFVGVVQSMQNGHYCEGNEHFYVDGAISPQINGTGTEDYYLGCFWPNTVYSGPFAMCAQDIQLEGGSMAGAYRIPSSYARFHLEAPIPFFRSIDARIQHGGMSDIRSNYRSLAFCYLRGRPALRETDFIDVGNPASESMHRYTAEGSEVTGVVTARPEGEYFETAEDEDGRRHGGSEITFTVAIDPKNAGVRLRRRLDQAGLPQAADVYVDAKFAGRWVHAFQNPHLRWFDSDFDIHSSHTHGKTSLAIKLVAAAGQDLGPYSDFSYRVGCFEPGPEAPGHGDAGNSPQIPR